MSTKIDAKPESELELVICRLVDAPAASLYRAWTDPALLVQWFAPKPWTTASAIMDVRAGGSSMVVMKSPEGQEMPCPGVYLEVVPNQKLVFTDAYTQAWKPSAKPFFTGILTFEDAGNGQTRYTARAIHWTKEARDQHQAMGFEEGWGICTDQLEEVASKL